MLRRRAAERPGRDATFLEALRVQPPSAKAYRKAGYEGEAASRFGLIFGNSGPQLRICSDFMAVNAEFTRKEAIRHMAEVARQAPDGPFTAFCELFTSIGLTVLTRGVVSRGGGSVRQY